MEEENVKKFLRVHKEFEKLNDPLPTDNNFSTWFNVLQINSELQLINEKLDLIINNKEVK